MQVLSINNQYASGMRRLAAFFIDHILVSAILSTLFWQIWDWPFNFEVIRYPFHGHHWNINMFGHNFLIGTLMIIYYAAMESSKYQATLGKIAMGIKVVGYNGQRLDFSKALLRNLSKIISGLIFCIGYIMILFDERKQGLHDKIADAFVVRQ